MISFDLDFGQVSLHYLSLCPLENRVPFVSEHGHIFCLWCAYQVFWCLQRLNQVFWHCFITSITVFQLESNITELGIFCLPLQPGGSLNAGAFGIEWRGQGKRGNFIVIVVGFEEHGRLVG